MGFFQASGILNRRGFFGGATAFKPSDIAGLQLWLDATTGLFDATSGGSAVTTDGSAVARWEDQSGNGNHVTQTTLNNRPVLKTSIQNSKNIIRFDGTNDYFGRSKINLTKCTIFIAMSSTKNDIRHIFIQWGPSAGPSNNQIHFWINSARYRCFFRDSAGTEKQVSQTSDKTSNFVALGTLFDSTAAFYVGDVTNGTDTFNGTLNSTNSHLGIGVKLDGGGSPADPSYLDGDIGEIIVFDSALSADNRTKIFDYLKTKWGL